MDWKKVKPIIQLALKEDIGPGDITTRLLVPQGKKASAIVIAKEAGILCGLEVVKEVFRQVDKYYRVAENSRVRFVSRVKDGGEIKKGQEILKISGRARTILTGERTALNFLQRLSGIATLTRKYVKAAHKAQGTRHKAKSPRIYDTRKTTPGLRYLEKYAVRVGGGYNHRMGLWDGVLIKDNHLKLCQFSRFRRLREKIPEGRRIEMEAQNLAQLKQALAAEADIIMLDNMKMPSLKKAVALIRSQRGKNCEIEVSGKINLKNIGKIAKLNIDRISIGALTHSAAALDFSLEIIGQR